MPANREEKETEAWERSLASAIRGALGFARLYSLVTGARCEAPIEAEPQPSTALNSARSCRTFRAHFCLRARVALDSGAGLPQRRRAEVGFGSRPTLPERTNSATIT